MTVLIPHPDNIAEIKKYQKSLLDFANKDGLTFVPVHPLWFPLPSDFYSKFCTASDSQKNEGLFENSDSADDSVNIFYKNSTGLTKTELSEIAASIKKITISASDDKTKLILKFQADDEKSIEFPVITPYKKNAVAPVNFSGFDGNFSKMNVRIFRIADSISLSPKTMALSAFVWKKLEPIS